MKNFEIEIREVATGETETYERQGETINEVLSKFETDARHRDMVVTSIRELPSETEIYLSQLKEWER